MSALFTKLRYIGSEEIDEPGPWAWSIVDVETGQQMVRESPTREDAVRDLAAMMDVLS